MADYKYIMFQTTDGRCIPIIFPGVMVHADVAMAISVGVLKDGAAVVAAGHISALHISGTHGNSETLGIGSDARDEDVINHYPYSNGLPDVIPGMAALMREAYLKILAGDGK